jgi:SEL1 protein
MYMYQILISNGQAHLYMGFAVLGGDLIAEQTLGYWHNAGVAALKSCEEAAFYYSRIGEQVVKNFRDGPPLGRTLPPFKPSLSEVEAGGLYGPGVSGPGDPNFKQSVMKTSQALSTKDIIEYYSLQADGGDAPAQLLVGQVYYQGTDGVPINYALARKYLYMAAKQLSTLKTAKGMKGMSEKRILGGQAASYLGQMYWRGEGVEQNNVTARKWFEKGAEVKNALSLNALGIMHEEGIAGFEKVGLSFAHTAPMLMECRTRLWLYTISPKPLLETTRML